MFTAYGSNLQTLCSTGLQVCVKNISFSGRPLFASAYSVSGADAWVSLVTSSTSQALTPWRIRANGGHPKHVGPSPCVTVGAEAKPGPSSPACASPSAPPARLPPVCVCHGIVRKASGPIYPAGVSADRCLGWSTERFA